MSLGDSAPPAPFGQPDVRTADLDFDKRVDMVQSIPSGTGFCTGFGSTSGTKLIPAQ